MAKTQIAYFQNSQGAERIEVGAKKFMCVGALPPFDHPHVFLEMGKGNNTTCPYCATNYVFNSKLDENSSNPIEAIFNPKVA